MFRIVFLILFLIIYWGFLFILSFLLSKEDILFSCINEDENRLIENAWGNYSDTLRHWRLRIKFVKIGYAFFLLVLTIAFIFIDFKFYNYIDTNVISLRYNVLDNLYSLLLFSFWVIIGVVIIQFPLGFFIMYCNGIGGEGYDRDAFKLFINIIKKFDIERPYPRDKMPYSIKFLKFDFEMKKDMKDNPVSLYFFFLFINISHLWWAFMLYSKIIFKF